MTTDALAAATTPSAAQPTTPSTTPPVVQPAPSAALAQARAAAVEQGLVLPCTRRALLRRAGLGTAVLGSAGILAACGGTSETTAGTSGGDGSSSGSAGDGGSGASVAASEVPEGSAVVVQAGGQEVVLAQPTAGQYVAYSAVCTHAGGIVQAASGTQVKCPLHGSVFDAGDGGAVLQGPATKPLESLTVTASGDQLTIA